MNETHACENCEKVEDSGAGPRLPDGWYIIAQSNIGDGEPDSVWTFCTWTCIEAYRTRTGFLR